MLTYSYQFPPCCNHSPAELIAVSYQPALCPLIHCSVNSLTGFPMRFCSQVLYHLLSVRATCPAHLSHLNSTEPNVCACSKNKTQPTCRSSTRRPGFYTRPVHVECFVGNLELGQVFPEYFSFPPVSIILPLLHTR